MRKLLLALLILALASPAWADTFIWTAAVSADATVAGNWTDANGDPVLAPPGNGDTIDATSSTQPTTPLASGAFNFDITDPAVQGLDLAKFLVGAATAVDVSVSGGAYCIWSTTEPITENTNVQGGRLDFTASGTTAAAGQIFVLSGGTLGVTNASGNLDVNGGITGSGNEGEDNGTINLVGAITGNVNLSSLQAGYTWTGAGTVTVTVDLAAVMTLDMGTNADNDIKVVVNSVGAVTLGNSFRCDKLTMTAANTFNFNGKTVTVGASGFTCAGGTMAANVSNVGGIAVAESCSASWLSSYGNNTPTVTVPAGITLTVTNTLRTRAAHIAGILSIDSGKALQVYSNANDFLTVSQPAAGLGSCGVFSEGPATWTNSGVVDMGGLGFWVYSNNSDPFTLSQGARLACGALDLGNSSSSGAGTGILTMTGGSLAVSGNVTVASSGSSNRSGKLILSKGVPATIGGTVSASRADANNALTLGSSPVHAGGNWTLAGITTAFGSSRIYATGPITINGATATALTASGPILTGYGGPLTLSNMTATTGGTIYARRWVDGGSNGTVVKTLAPPFMLRR